MANYEEVIRAWADAWGNATPEEFAAQYTEDGVYIDHAFRFGRSGRDAIAEHSAIWHNSITDFRMTPREVRETDDGALMTWVATGTFARDLAAMPATGKDFVMHGTVWLKINAEGKITVTEEYYSTTFAQDNQESYALFEAGQL
ncbi:SgcJ/EcaC family oxidoreductase [Nocardia sp. R6R-6]|uniref:SgcJ/EcaC family oxidoreductase n=1 Tax=Nocardia sp. R6R-6 TaxID=3459303 RepID=UPI00403E27C2